MKEGDTLFVRVDYRNEEKEFEEGDFEDHLNYLKKVAGERFFLGGGFENEKGGMIIIRASSLTEATEIAENDPIIKKELYTCKVYEWNLVLLSDKTVE